MPLTVQVAVPPSWKGLVVKQAGRETKGKVLEIDGRPTAQLGVRPNVEPALVSAVD